MDEWMDGWMNGSNCYLIGSMKYLIFVYFDNISLDNYMEVIC